MRRLISGASVFTNTEKVHVVRRLFSGLGAVGVARVLVMPDSAGLSLGISRVADQHRPQLAGPWPDIEVLEFEQRNSAVDSVIAAQEMVARGVGAIVVLGGDGTARAVASACDSTPMLALSTGTNNAFGITVDGTVAGLAAGLVSTGACAVAEACYRAKKLIVRHGAVTEIALVDMAIVDQDRVGARAVWDPDLVRELAVTFAEPHAVGLSAIAGAVSPCGRREPSGRLLRMGDGRNRAGRACTRPDAVGGRRRARCVAARSPCSCPRRTASSPSTASARWCFMSMVLDQQSNCHSMARSSLTLKPPWPSPLGTASLFRRVMPMRPPTMVWVTSGCTY